MSANHNNRPHHPDAIEDCTLEDDEIHRLIDLAQRGSCTMPRKVCEQELVFVKRCEEVLLRQERDDKTINARSSSAALGRKLKK